MTDAESELIRTCEAMRTLPVISDNYWGLKTRRNELRPLCPDAWLTATGYDGSRYDPVFRDGFPAGWRERWRVIREFAERWFDVPMPDVGGRLKEIEAEEERLGRLPPAVHEYIAYAHDVAAPDRVGVVHRDVYTMRPIEGQSALSLMRICEGNVQWAVRDTDFGQDDPPVYAYYWVEPDYTRYVPAKPNEPAAPTVTDFVMDFVDAYKPDSGCFMNDVPDCDRLTEELDPMFPVRLSYRSGVLYEGNHILVRLDRSRGCITVCTHQRATWQQVPSIVWQYARTAHTRGGMFLSEEDRQRMGHHWREQLGPAPPPLS